MLSTATAAEIRPMTLCEMRASGIPNPLAISLNGLPRTVQVQELRRAEGLSPSPAAAWGLTFRVDQRYILLAIARD